MTRACQGTPGHQTGDWAPLRCEHLQCRLPAVHNEGTLVVVDSAVPSRITVVQSQPDCPGTMKQAAATTLYRLRHKHVQMLPLTRHRHLLQRPYQALPTLPAVHNMPTWQVLA